MAANDHLSPQQGAARFYHASQDEFEPGQVLTREGAWRAVQPARVLERFEKDQRPMAEKGPSFAFGGTYNEQGHPTAHHLYYGSPTFVANKDHELYGPNLYEVRPETAQGREVQEHEPDPEYPREAEAYRTTGRLRVIRKVGQ